MICGCLDELEYGEVGHVTIPFPSVAAPVADLQVSHTGSAQLSGMRQRVDDRSDLLHSEAADNARIQEVS